MSLICNPKAFGAIKLLMLVICISLSVLPVSMSHAATPNQPEALHDHQKLKTPAVQILDLNCENHASNSKSDHEHEPKSCCKAFCATIAMSEMTAIASMTIFRPKFRIFPDSAVLPGEYPTPHRPPNA